MIDSYVECLVARRKSASAMLLKIFVYALCVIFIIGGLIGFTILFIPGLIIGAVGYFLCPSPDVEFEYLYMGKELTVDKIFAKEKRKTAGVYDLNKMEKMCPSNSHELDAYKNRQIPVKDYSSREPDSKPFVIVYKDEAGESLIYIEPNEELLNSIKSSCPRKVIEY
ncbi:MAG: DUF6106 family protein [Lachnospiraceae bacterium]|nr:DUF6106 family protein [Lachnospiraceae bacterium]